MSSSTMLQDVGHVHSPVDSGLTDPNSTWEVAEIKMQQIIEWSIFYFNRIKAN
jgi:hypothetical protein